MASGLGEELKLLLKTLSPVICACLFGYSMFFWLSLLHWLGLVPIALEVAPLYVILRNREKAHEELMRGPGGGDAKSFLSPEEFEERIQYLVNATEREKKKETQ